MGAGALRLCGIANLEEQEPSILERDKRHGGGENSPSVHRRSGCTREGTTEAAGPVVGGGAGPPGVAPAAAGEWLRIDRADRGQEKARAFWTSCRSRGATGHLGIVENRQGKR